MTKQEILDRIYNIIDNKGFNDVDLDLLRNDLEEKEGPLCEMQN